MKVTGNHVHSSWGKSPGPCLLMTARQILHGSQTKLRVAPKRKTSAAAKHLRKQTADCTALQSQIDWTSNHGTIEGKTSNPSRIWSAAGWCPAATMPPDANSMYLKERLLISLNPPKFVLARSNSKSHNFFIWVVTFNLTILWVRENLANIRRPIIHWVVYNQLFGWRFLFVGYCPGAFCT